MSTRVSAIKRSNGMLYTFSEVDIKNMSPKDKAMFDWQVDATPPPQFVTDAMTAKQAETQTDHQPRRGRKQKK